MNVNNKMVVFLRKTSTFLAVRGLLNFLSDSTFLKMRYRLCVGKPLDLEKPKTFNEKIQWLKIYNRCPEYTLMVDKILV